MAEFLAQGDLKQGAVSAVEYTMAGENIDLPNISRGIRNGNTTAISVAVRFANGDSFIYRNIQPGVTEPCQVDQLLTSGTTASAVIEVLF